jgi:glycerophosphoryl diester phosphodiesterase
LPLTQRRSLPHEQLAMPCLQDVLQRYAGRAFLDIELKTVGMEAAVLESLRQHPPRRGYVVSSFLPQVLRELAACDAETPLGLICDSTRQLALWPKLSLAFVIPHYKLASQELVEELHAAGKKIIVWTVNPEDQMRRAADWGVDGIVSDDPELLARVIA